MKHGLSCTAVAAILCCGCSSNESQADAGLEATDAAAGVPALECEPGEIIAEWATDFRSVGGRAIVRAENNLFAGRFHLDGEKIAGEVDRFVAGRPVLPFASLELDPGHSLGRLYAVGDSPGVASWSSSHVVLTEMSIYPETTTIDISGVIDVAFLQSRQVVVLLGEGGEFWSYAVFDAQGATATPPTMVEAPGFDGRRNLRLHSLRNGAVFSVLDNEQRLWTGSPSQRLSPRSASRCYFSEYDVASLNSDILVWAQRCTSQDHVEVERAGGVSTSLEFAQSIQSLALTSGGEEQVLAAVGQRDASIELRLLSGQDFSPLAIGTLSLEGGASVDDIELTPLTDEGLFLMSVAHNFGDIVAQRIAIGRVCE